MNLSLHSLFQPPDLGDLHCTGGTMSICFIPWSPELNMSLQHGGSHDFLQPDDYMLPGVHLAFFTAITPC